MKAQGNLIKPFGMRDKIGYMMGDFGYMFSFSFVSSYMMLFFVTSLGILPAHFAVIIMIAKIWDAVNDPIIGRIIDKAPPGKNGKYKRWITGGSYPLLISTVLMFLFIPNAAYWAKLALCLGSYLVWSVASTAVNVPYGSLSNAITAEPLERSALSTYRSTGAMAAQVPTLVVVPLLLFGDDKQPIGSRFLLIALVLGIAGFFSYRVLHALVSERIGMDEKPDAKFNYMDTFKSFLKNKPMLGLTISSMAYLALIGNTMSSMQYIFIYYFEKPDLLSLGTVIGGFPVLFAIIASKPLVKKFGKGKTCTYPFLIGVVAAGIMTFVKITNPFLWLTLLGLVMLSSGLHMILTWAMAADCIDYQEMQTGRHEDAAVYATYSLFRKIAQGIGSAAFAVALNWAGYIASNGAAQADGVAEKIRFATGVIPFAGALICFLSMFFLYRLDESMFSRKEDENADCLEHQ
jgi:glycoside/pentoside/hexuronide:cation symporter, GPH family